MNLYQFKNTKKKGVGVFAKEFIQSGKTIAIIKEDQFITCDILPDFYEFLELLYNPNLCNKVLFAYFLAAMSVISPNHKQEHNHIIKYINQLPKNIHGLILWNKTQLILLKNKTIYQNIRQKKQRIFISYEIIKKSVQKTWKYPLQRGQYRLFNSIQQIQKVQFNSVLKFYSYIQSRGVFHITSRDLTGQIGALVPIIDKFNHSKYPNCTVECRSNLIIKSLRNIDSGEELVVRYGEFTKEQFLQHYGFLPQWQGPQLPQSDNYREKLAQFYTKITSQQQKDPKQDDYTWEKIKERLFQRQKVEQHQKAPKEKQ